MYESKACRIGHVCLSVHLPARWTDVDEMDVLPLGTTHKLYFSVSTIGNTNMAGKQTCEVG
jgi:hypothetical protein